MLRILLSTISLMMFLSPAHADGRNTHGAQETPSSAVRTAVSHAMEDAHNAVESQQQGYVTGHAATQTGVEMLTDVTP